MTVNATLWENLLQTAPGASSTSTSAHAYTRGYTYLVFVTQARTDSIQPGFPTLSGLDVDFWWDVSPANFQWDITGASRRSTYTFIGEARATGNGALQVSYATQPADINICVVELPGAVPDITGLAYIEDYTGATTATSLNEPINTGGPAVSDSVYVAYATLNTNDTGAHLETVAVGGDTDWTAFTTRNSGSSPTGVYLCGTADSALDSTPGIYAVNISAYYMVVVEIEAAALTANLPFVGIRAVGGAQIVTPPPPPQPSYSLLVGAAIDTDSFYTATSYPAATLVFEGQIGATMEIARRYDSGTPATFPSGGNSANCFSQDIGVRNRFISIKGNSYSTPTQAQFEAIIATIPDDGYMTWFTSHHEPENDIKKAEAAGGTSNHTVAWFQGVLNRLHAAWVAQGRPAHVRPSVSLMGWLEQGGSYYYSSTSADWFPSADKIADFSCWWDPYDINGGSSMESKIDTSLDLWIARGGDPTRMGISETGSHPAGVFVQNPTTAQDATLAAWIQAACSYSRSRQLEGWCWFHSAVGAEGPWWLRGSQALARMGTEINA